MSLNWSELCNTDKECYFAYLYSNVQCLGKTHDGGLVGEFLSRRAGGGATGLCGASGYVFRDCVEVDASVDAFDGQRVGGHGQAAPGRFGSGVFGGEGGDDREDETRRVRGFESENGGCEFGKNDVTGGRGVNDVGSKPTSADSRGKWYWHNKKKKVNAKLRRANWRVPEKQAGRCETVLSGASGEPPSYLSALSDAERLAKESLARRRAAENAVAEKLAKMKLESLEDEKKCQEYADLKRQRVIQWQNEALAKSQASLEKCKSIDPGSSSSQYEIRRQAKENEDLKYERKLLIERFSSKCGAAEVADIVSECRAPGEGTLNELDLLAAHWAPNSCSSIDPADGY